LLILKHKKEAMTVESLVATLDVEEKARSKDVSRSVPQEGGSKANVVRASLLEIRTRIGKRKDQSRPLISRRRGTRKT
jgi:hypothetical protein